ncbi:MAG: DUF2382 domain-containing protein [Scytonematopsis contorta HA4267-MV1]|nr:DUF2382 domain-containing protein [Scytonematopsis contorta HA4267-MV1]
MQCVTCLGDKLIERKYYLSIVKEEFRVKKVVEQDTVEAQEKVRREELDINAPHGEIKERRG